MRERLSNSGNNDFDGRPSSFYCHRRNPAQFLLIKQFEFGGRRSLKIGLEVLIEAGGLLVQANAENLSSPHLSFNASLHSQLQYCSLRLL